MARLNLVKKARKDYPDKGIMKGDSYYWWQFQYGPKMMSKTKPQRSQLTQSEYKSTIFNMVDNFTLDESNPEGCVQDLVSELETLRDEQESKLDSMPDHLRDSSIVQDRYTALDDAISELEELDLTAPDREDFETDEEYTDAMESLIGLQDDIRNILSNLEI